MEPIPALAVSGVRFDETVDVVVVGLGAAGASAVVGARQAGADVLAVERSAGPGGTSANSGGLIYLGGGTALQRACGFEDSPDNMAAFLRAALGPGGDDDRVNAYCDGSPDHFDWLVSIGVPFRAAFCDEPNRESADDAGLLFSGGEDTYPFDQISVPVPRGHKPQCVDSAGGFLMQRLGAAVSTSSARVVVDTPAEAVIVDGAHVVGLLVRTDDGSRAIRALGGVILSSGGFIHNEAMVDEHCPLAHVPDAAWRIGTPNDDGRGIRMGAGAGAAATRLDSFECALPLGPPHRLARAILVNRHGERFINEDAYTGRIGFHALQDHDGFVFMITDDLIHEPNVIGLRVAYAAATPEELAADLDVPPDALARTVRDYNEAAARGDDPAFHKRGPYLQPIGVPPASGIGAIDLRVDHGAIYATFTLGGLVTDPDGVALDGAGDRIPGLYAVGRTAASLAAHHYASGISLGDGTFFGRCAGRHAAGRALSERPSLHE
jgi:3-oxo-5alpha-steroid 4-dehydrogenase